MLHASHGACNRCNRPIIEDRAKAAALKAQQNVLDFQAELRYLRQGLVLPRPRRRAPRRWRGSGSRGGAAACVRADGLRIFAAAAIRPAAHGRHLCALIAGALDSRASGRLICCARSQTSLGPVYHGRVFTFTSDWLDLCA
jgi:hypothetical protein